MKRNYPHLFTPFNIRDFIFKNRVVSAPIGAWVFSPRNFIFDYAISMFEQKALGGAAAVTVGHTEVNAEEDDADNFGLYFNLKSRQGIAALSEFATAIQQHGAHASVQLNYDGPYGPSSMKSDRGPDMIEMTEEKMMKTIGQYADSAKRLKQAGFNMCMIHGAHGWLPMKFLMPATNHRTDKYGGSLENRMRFPIMLVNAVREAIGDDMMLEYRLSGFDAVKETDLFEETVTYLNAIRDKVDLIHISAGGGGTSGGMMASFPTYLDPRGKNVHYAEALKKRVGIPIIVVGAITDPALAEEIIAEGKADFVAMARPLIADPELPNKARRGQEEDIIPCINCYKCLDSMHHTHSVFCSVNPRSAREHRISEVTPAKVSRKVAIVGGGPAGMQAAITAAERGHEVTLYEKSDSLGGILKITDNDPVKYLLKNYKDYLVRQVEKHGVEVRLNTEATPDLVEEGTPDVVIVASGSNHIIPDIPGIDRDNVLTAIDAYKADAKLGDRVVIIGGNMSGCELALYLQQLGKEITIVEMAERLCADASMVLNMSIQSHLDEKVSRMTNAKCTEISDQGVHVSLGNGDTEIVPADSVVLAVGMRANETTTAHTMLDCALDVVPVGDCVRPATVMEASHTAFYAALDI